MVTIVNAEANRVVTIVARTSDRSHHTVTGVIYINLTSLLKIIFLFFIYIHKIGAIFFEFEFCTEINAYLKFLKFLTVYVKFLKKIDLLTFTP